MEDDHNSTARLLFHGNVVGVVYTAVVGSDDQIVEYC